ncbi:MAG: Ig-like domain-containing protein [Armatimonadetes bacterium]|nr:Ig-like domain-containing protein [Armatimonadota bacterium]MDW8027659.1 Ig-like domain-containing protein [Armatimonadota bacterium]
MRNFALLISFAIALTFCRTSQSQSPLTQRHTFLLTASPPQIPADGKSTCEITVRIDDPSVSDGTIVHFTSSLEGTIIEPQAVLRNGIARVKLRAGTIPGVTVVTAFFGVSRQTVEVQLLPIGVEASRERQVIHIEGDYVAYAPAMNFVAGSGKVKLVYKGWEIQSDVRLDLWLNTKTVVAEGQPGMNRVMVTNGKVKFEGDRFIADIDRQVGILVKVVPEAKRIIVKGWLLEGGKEEDVMGLTEPPSPTDIDINWVRGRSLTIYPPPNERIVIRRAQIYSQGRKMIALPIYVEAKGGLYLSGYYGGGLGSSFGLQGVSITAYSGFQIDTPIYYRADLRGTGAIRLQYFGGEGFSAYRKGFALSLEEQYVFGKLGEIEGGILLDQFTRSDWGLRWQHFHRLGKSGRLNLFLDYPRHEDLFIRLGYNGAIRNSSIGIELNLQKPKSQGLSHSIHAYAYLPGGLIGKSGISYNLSLGAIWRPGGLGQSFGWSADSNFNLPMMRLGKENSISSQFGISILQLGSKWEIPWQFSAMMNRPIGKMGNLTLTYNLDKGRSFWGTGGSTAETLSLTLMLRPSYKWQIFGMSSLNLRGGGQLHSIYSYFMPSRLWRLGFEVSYQGYSGFKYFDYGFRITRDLGNGVGISLNWSRSRGRFYLEFGGIYW